MKIIAVHDNDGRILAAVKDDGTYDGPRPEPSGQGQQAGTFDVPASSESESLEEICRTHRIDTQSKRLAKR